MKPQPRSRVTKASQVDPAALPTLAREDSNASQRVKAAVIHKASRASDPGNTGKAGVAPRPAGQDTKVTIRMSADLAGRARSAWRLTCANPDSAYPSFSSWLASVIEDGVHSVEVQHNGGQFFTPTPAGEIPTGRPIR